MNKFRLLPAMLCLILTGVTFALSCGANECEDLLSGKALTAEQKVDAVISTYDPEIAFEVKAARIRYWDHLREGNPFAKALTEKAVMELLADPENVALTRKLSELLSLGYIAPAGTAPKDVFKAWLEKRMPRALAEKLLGEAFNAQGEISGSKGLKRAMGFLTLEEMREAAFGRDSDSLLGRYLSETGATEQMRSFKGGPERRYVAVSPASFPAFVKHFSTDGFMSILGHAFVLNEGRVVDYNGNILDLRAMGPGGVLPMVALSSFEAQRLKLYLMAVDKYKQFGYADVQNLAKYAWGIAGFCAAGGYKNCTQFLGNMPIGETLTKTYTFPQDQEHSPNAPPVKADLMANTSQESLIRLIWKAPGNTQFADVIGQKAANERGDFANPGWAIHTLLGPTSAERVPVVFIFVVDHRQLIPAELQPQFEQPM